MSVQDLKCEECGKTCGFALGCDLYAPVDEPHLHCPGGLTSFGLCHHCEESCLEIHRPVAPDGTWKWIKDCGNRACKYCQALIKAAPWLKEEKDE